MPKTDLSRRLKLKSMRFVAATLLGLFLAMGSIATPSRFSRSTFQAANDKKEVTVWVNTHSGVYHCPGSRWYGTTKEGKYMGECEAVKAGYRPAYGKPCGSECR
jgi:hypothetical protein